VLKTASGTGVMLAGAFEVDQLAHQGRSADAGSA